LSELHDAWSELVAATPRGWQVGRPEYQFARGEWTLEAVNRAGGPSAMRYVRAASASEAGVVREMVKRLSARTHNSR
jgi:hypothetical protein